MRKICLFIGLISCIYTGHAQSVEKKLAAAIQQLEKDSQMRHAILSFAVADAKTGKLIYGRNEQTGLAPASTQKIITSAAAFELLGNNFRYKTELGYEGSIDDSRLVGGLIVIGSGDPTLGSWRYKDTRDTVILDRFAQALKTKGINYIAGPVVVQEFKFSPQAIPDGWIWQDIGNYYGAGAREINWKENQYDLILRSGDKIGDSVQIVNKENEFVQNKHVNLLKAAAKGSGDNAYIYLPIGADGHALLQGTIPIGERSFSISGAMVNPPAQLNEDMVKRLIHRSIKIASHPNDIKTLTGYYKNFRNIYTHHSPTLDSINYWFMRRSINLYGEALIKTIAYEKTGHGATDTGARIIRNFWAEKGIDKDAINIVDGSGLSPQNRVTADALVKVLQYARALPWYTSFYQSLPSFNNMKLKSGSIGGARAFAGYHTSAQGKEYVIAIIVNNYSGSSGEIVRKIYKVLDVLK